jgi:hypothetical protein
VAPWFGEPWSEVALGASIRRGPGLYGEHFAGSIGQACLWQGALTDQQVGDSFLAGVPTYYGSLAVGDTRHELALAGFRPNPAVRNLNVAFTLPTNEPASLELIDVSGRRVAARDVGSLGPGSHVVSLGRGTDLPAGVYMLRLRQATRTIVTKAAIVR